MFRIHIYRDSESIAFTIEGKLMGQFVQELERCWRRETSAEPENRIVVNLAAVSFVDVGGKNLLRLMRQRGATLLARGCLMRAIVHEIEAGLRKEELL
jgi:hypothetical protein